MPIINVVGADSNLGNFATLGDLQTAYPTGKPGDTAIVDNGSPSGNAVLYIWDDTDGAWQDSTAAGAYIPLTQKAAANGVATLDGGGKVPVGQLPSSVMEFKGTWNATTNIPALVDGGAFDNGDVYRVNVAGTQDLGSGPQTYAVGDWVVYNGAIWEKSLNGTEEDPIVGAVNGIVKSDGAGNIAAAIEDTDYQGVLAEGAFADGDKTKLDGIEAGAQVNIELAANTIIDLDNSMTSAEIQALIDAQPSDLNGYQLIFRFADGTYNLTEDMRFANFYGGTVFIQNTTPVSGSLHTNQAVILNFNAAPNFNSGIWLNNCTNVWIQDLRIQDTGGTGPKYPIIITDTACSMLGCYIEAADGGTLPCVDFQGGANGSVSYTYLSGGNAGVFANGSHDVRVYFSESIAPLPTYGVYADASALTVQGGDIVGATANELIANFGSVNRQSEYYGYDNTISGLTATNVKTAIDEVVAGGVTKVGTPVDNQVGVWTGDGTLEGDPGLTFDAKVLTLESSISGVGYYPLIMKNTAGGANDGVGMQFHDDDGIAFDIAYQKSGTNAGYLDIYEDRVAPVGVPVMRMWMADKTVELWGALKTDNIVEHTAAAGVTLDGVLLKDGGLSLATGATVNEIDTVIAAPGTDAQVPTSKAVVDYVSTAAPGAHAASHTDGTDDIQDATNAQKGLLTNVAQTIGGRKDFDTPPRLETLNTGNEVLTTDTDGDVQESGVKVETAPTGGSGITLVEYASAPTAPAAGFEWIQRIDANTVKKCYFDGTQTYFVVMSA